MYLDCFIILNIRKNKEITKIGKIAINNLISNHEITNNVNYYLTLYFY